MRVVTPAGLLVTRPVPHTSTGPSVREMVLGSEGRLGVITEATVQVRRVPERRVILGYLFPTWSDGLAAMRDIAASETAASVTRVSDANETAFSFATRKAPTVLDRIKSRALTTYLRRRRGFDIDAMCLSFIGYEGTQRHVAAQRKAVGRIVARHGGLSIGASPGELYDQKKFDTPYIRDFLLDRGTLGDVSETAAPWSQLSSVYDAVIAAAHGAFDELGVRGYIMCHLSHSYHSGACLYFTFAFTPSQPARRARAVRPRQVRDPAGVHRYGRDALASPRGGDRARPLARGGHLRAGCRDAAGAVQRCGSRSEPEPGEDRLTRVFVTGASGFIGGALAARLLEGGDEVVGLARSDEAAAVVAGRGCEVARGDLLDEDSLAAGMQGCALAYHVAGVNTHCPSDPAMQLRVNVDGAEAAVRAAARAGIPRMVFTSSAASVGEPAGTVGREDTTHRGSYLSVYDRSKHLGEQAAFRAAAGWASSSSRSTRRRSRGPAGLRATGKIIIDYLNGRLQGVRAHPRERGRHRRHGGGTPARRRRGAPAASATC